MTPNPKDYATLEEFLAAVNAAALEAWMKAGKPMPTPQGGDGGGPG